MLTERFIESLEFENVRRLMYGLHGSGFANEMDIQRWHEQGFQFFSEPLLLYNSNESAYGLVQSKGPISAFLLTSTQCHTNAVIFPSFSSIISPKRAYNFSVIRNYNYSVL